jgi:ubiquinone/menaquinone biosynthesis C-methylase UbiE
MKEDWDKFWIGLDGKRNFLSKFLRFYRIQIIAKGVDYYINKWFKSEGVFIECGAGTSETTLKTEKKNRILFALDYSEFVLRKTVINPKIDGCINADIFSLPFKNNSIDGIWNVGVMEHFTLADIDKILREFERVLKENGHIILFWPMTYSPYLLFVSILEFVINGLSKKGFQLYPDEISRLKSKHQGKKIVESCGFENAKIYFNYRDAFSFGVVIARKREMRSAVNGAVKERLSK